MAFTGPSGSSKTTLLSILGGRRPRSVFNIEQCCLNSEELPMRHVLLDWTISGIAAMDAQLYPKELGMQGSVSKGICDL